MKLDDRVEDRIVNGPDGLFAYADEVRELIEMALHIERGDIVQQLEDWANDAHFASDQLTERDRAMSSAFTCAAMMVYRRMGLLDEESDLGKGIVVKLVEPRG